VNIKTIRVKNPNGNGWITVNFQGVIRIEGKTGVGAIIQVDNAMPQAIDPEYIHPDDYKLIVEDSEKK
jgi:hypothetical protein